MLRFDIKVDVYGPISALIQKFLLTFFLVLLLCNRVTMKLDHPSLPSRTHCGNNFIGITFTLLITMSRLVDQAWDP